LGLLRLAVLLLATLVLAGHVPGRDVHAAPKGNLNVLFLGTDGPQLIMASVYSINHRFGYRSGAVFFPVDTLFAGGEGEKYPLSRMMEKGGITEVRAALGKALGVDISYHVRVDRQVLSELKGFIRPIVVEGEEVEIENLFTMPAGPRDSLILGALMAEFTRPQVFFVHLPGLVLAFRRHIETDFSLHPENLLLHYRIARNVDTAAIPKVIAPTTPVCWQGLPAEEVSQLFLDSVLDQLTGDGGPLPGVWQPAPAGY